MDSFPDGKANRAFPVEQFKKRKAFKIDKNSNQAIQGPTNIGAATTNGPFKVSTQNNGPSSNITNYQALFNDRSRKRGPQNVFDKYGQSTQEIERKKQKYGWPQQKRYPNAEDDDEEEEEDSELEGDDDVIPENKD